MRHRFCPRYSTSLTACDDRGYLIYKARCKQWDCPFCALVNMRIWRARIMGEVERDERMGKDTKWYFWTLTLDGKDHTGLSSIKVWRKSWQKLMKRIKRNLGKFRYVRVFEPHKSGTLHVHMLTDRAYEDLKKKGNHPNCRYESGVLSAHLKDLKLGRIHDIKEIVTSYDSENGRARNVSAYVTKYMTKDIQSDMRFKLKESGNGRVRLIQTSAKWYNQKPENHNNLDWDNRALSITEYEFLGRGDRARDIAQDRNITIDDFYDHDHYPNQTSDTIDIADMGLEDNGQVSSKIDDVQF